MAGRSKVADAKRRHFFASVRFTPAHPPRSFPGSFLPDAQPNGGFEIIRKPFTQAELGAAFARVRLAQ